MKRQDETGDTTGHDRTKTGQDRTTFTRRHRRDYAKGKKDILEYTHFEEDVGMIAEWWDDNRRRKKENRRWSLNRQNRTNLKIHFLDLVFNIIDKREHNQIFYLVDLLWMQRSLWPPVTPCWYRCQSTLYVCEPNRPAPDRSEPLYHQSTAFQRSLKMTK